MVKINLDQKVVGLTPDMVAVKWFLVYSNGYINHFGV